jgi:hypothetical protein
MLFPSASALAKLVNLFYHLYSIVKLSPCQQKNLRYGLVSKAEGKPGVRWNGKERQSAQP